MGKRLFGLFVGIALFFSVTAYADVPTLPTGTWVYKSVRISQPYKTLEVCLKNQDGKLFRYVVSPGDSTNTDYLVVKILADTLWTPEIISAWKNRDK